jgi:tRNA-splicing ligase RtcB (3'-phosphate/5'-hydroxy nucleic acid ligase)
MNGTLGPKSTTANSPESAVGCHACLPRQRGFVGGTMGERSVILEGVDSPESKTSLYSTVHGAGHVLGRKQATGTTDRKTGVVKREGLVKPEMMQGRLTRAKVVLRGGGLDESPDCYKRLPEVLEAHGDTTRIPHTPSV